MPADQPLTGYVAFLRGINVGNIRIKMPDLKRAFECLGCQQVETILQTGNVIFQSDKEIPELKVLLEKGLSETFGYEAYVLLYQHRDLAQLVAGYPYAREAGHHAYLIFVQTPQVFADLVALAPTTGDEAQFIATGDQVIYWRVATGQSTDTPFAKIVAKAKYKATTTIRNLNTLEKMI
jgi:uncharacterized protein (DUF1697 family)